MWLFLFPAFVAFLAIGYAGVRGIGLGRRSFPRRSGSRPEYFPPTRAWWITGCLLSEGEVCGGETVERPAGWKPGKGICLDIGFSYPEGAEPLPANDPDPNFNTLGKSLQINHQMPVARVGWSEGGNRFQRHAAERNVALIPMVAVEVVRVHQSDIRLLVERHFNHIFRSKVLPFVMLVVHACRILTVGPRFASPRALCVLCGFLLLSGCAHNNVQPTISKTDLKPVAAKVGAAQKSNRVSLDYAEKIKKGGANAGDGNTVGLVASVQQTEAQLAAASEIIWQKQGESDAKTEIANSAIEAGNKALIREAIEKEKKEFWRKFALIGAPTFLLAGVIAGVLAYIALKIYGKGSLFGWLLPLFFFAIGIWCFGFSRLQAKETAFWIPDFRGCPEFEFFWEGYPVCGMLALAAPVGPIEAGPRSEELIPAQPCTFFRGLL